jgi:hypothetical protein
MPIEKMHAMSKEIAAFNKPWVGQYAPAYGELDPGVVLPDYAHARTD